MADYHTLSTDQLLAALETAGRNPDLDLIRACLGRREELAPTLLDWLDSGPEEDWPDDDDPRWYRAIHAGNLLIAYREPAALPLFIDILHDPDKEGQDLLEWFHDMLPAYGPAIVPALLDVLADRSVPEYSRNASSEILARIALQHPGEREDIVQALRTLLPPLAEDGSLILPPGASEDPDPIWAWMASALLDLQDVASLPQVVALFEADLMDEWLMDLDYYRQHMESGADVSYESEPADILRYYENQEKRDMWAADLKAPLPEPAPLPPPPYDEPAQPFVRSAPKAGRNDPCPCGSGRKYKHCCGRR